MALHVRAGMPQPGARGGGCLPSKVAVTNVGLHINA